MRAFISYFAILRFCVLVCIPAIASFGTASTASAQRANYQATLPAAVQAAYPDGAPSSQTQTVAADEFADPASPADAGLNSIAPSDVILQKEIDTLEAERSILKVQLGDGHPSVQVFDARIEAAEKALANLRRRNAGVDAKDGGEAFPATSPAMTDSETQKTIEQLQRAVRILAERLVALEDEVEKLKQ